MKNRLTIIVATYLLSNLFIANILFSGDTLNVYSHKSMYVTTDPSKGINHYKKWAVFPDNATSIRKITMFVKFECPDSLRCADWDYLDPILLEKQGGEAGKVLNYEIGRILTPYGGFFPHDWGFEWSADVTDFSIVLRDSVLIDYTHSGYEPSNDRGWNISIRFEIVKGLAVAEPVSITEVYHENFPYGDKNNRFEDKLRPFEFKTDPDCDYARLRIIQTGHGMDSPDNCGEFCSKWREIWFDDKLIEKRNVWKECGDNPLSPQAGTWIFDRANWCPGLLMQPELFDLNVIKGSKHTINLKMEPYIASKTNNGNQVISAYLIQYRSNISHNDVEIEDVIIPSNKDIYKRFNPSGANAKIIIKNNGSENLKSLTIKYNTNDNEISIMDFKCDLKPNKYDTIILPGLIKSKKSGNIFKVELSEPNGKSDDYPDDNRILIPFNPAPCHESTMVFHLRTNNQPEQNSYSLINSKGNTVYKRDKGSLEPNKIYSDTFRLTNDAYQLQFFDSEGDGLEFWFNSEGGFGEAKLMNKDNMLIKSFESDCGSGWIYNFTSGAIPDPVDSTMMDISLYPGRTSDFIALSFFSNKVKDIQVKLISDPGKEIVEQHQYNNLKEGHFTYDLRRYKAGRFYVKVFEGEKEIFSKRVRYAENIGKENEEYIYPEDSLVNARLKDWQDLKFGVLIHWGPYSEWGVVESWSLCPEDEPWCMRRGEYADNYSQYVSEYEKIRYKFNPEKFNPDKWAQACKNAGMKYLVATTKHHDGFCMFDTKYTNYKITDSKSIFSKNPKSNVIKEIFSSYRDQDFKIGAYFSKPDWHNDDYWWPYFPVTDRNVNYNPEKYPDKWNNFKKFTSNQIEELMQNYGKIDILWLDGGWVRPKASLTEETRPWLGKNQYIQDINMPEIAKMARINQPGLLIVDRTVHGEFENYRTPEQQIPVVIPPYPWESCITLGDSWYSTGPNEKYKSSYWIIHTLIKIVSKGGNFLLGIGPDKSGDLVPEVYKRLAATGKWMHLNSKAIYDTKPLAPYASGKFCFTQSKDEKTKYMFYLVDENEQVPSTVQLPVDLIKNHKELGLLGYDKKLKITDDKTKKLVKLPKEFVKKAGSVEALVFVLEE